LVRPHIEYAEAVWSPFKVGNMNIEKIENVQRRATKQVPTLKNMEYNERLKKLKMPTPFSIFSISPTLNGDQTASAYSI
jgi:hypothetical protein